MAENITGPLEISSFLKQSDPKVNVVIEPSHTVMFEGYIGIFKQSCGFSKSQMHQLCVLTAEKFALQRNLPWPFILKFTSSKSL